MKLEEVPVIGTIESLPDGLDQPYWDGLARGVVMIQRCPSCQTWIWGPRWLCPACLTPKPEWVEVEPNGRVFSWTRTWQKFAPEFADHVPYITVVVELPEAGGRSSDRRPGAGRHPAAVQAHLGSRGPPVGAGRRLNPAPLLCFLARLQRYSGQTGQKTLKPVIRSARDPRTGPS